MDATDTEYAPGMSASGRSSEHSRAAAVAAAQAALASEGSLRAAARKLNEDGVPTISGKVGNWDGRRVKWVADGAPRRGRGEADPARAGRRAAAVAAAQAALASEGSLRAAARKLNEDGVPTISGKVGNWDGRRVKWVADGAPRRGRGEADPARAGRRAAAVAAAQAALASEGSLRAAARKLNEDGVPTISGKVGNWDGRRVRSTAGALASGRGLLLDNSPKGKKPGRNVVGSLYLNALSPEDYAALKQTLLGTQAGNCFICEKPIDPDLHETDVDHVEPLYVGGRDDVSNFALTHSSCNRSKQASDLRVARVLARFADIRKECAAKGQGPNLSDVLAAYGGASHSLPFKVEDGNVRYSLDATGDKAIHTASLYKDDLSGQRYFFAKLPIGYLHHDDKINPRNIGGYLSKLVEEFHKGRPQLHVSLAWVSSEQGSSEVKVFDGQHKATAQVLLGVKSIPVRVFVDPDPDLLLTANTNAGTTLRQVAFDKSVQRRLGSALYLDRLERYRRERALAETDESFTERELIQYFKGEAREMKRYILDSVRDSITHSPENRLKDYIDFGGRAAEKPLSYSTIEKTFYSFFIYPEALDTPLDYRDDEDANPRALEIRQIVQLMNVVADQIYVGQFDDSLGTYRIENKIQKGEQLPEPHVRAFRLGKEEIIYVWLAQVGRIAQMYFTLNGLAFDDKKLFQYPFPDALWSNINAYIANLKGMPVWVNRDLSNTVFGGKQNYAFWQHIFETGKSPQSLQVLPAPINLLTMMNGAEPLPAPALA